MKFNCGPTWGKERDASREWHRWFAWWPVSVGRRDCRWLEYVNRRNSYYKGVARWLWEYRALGERGE